MKRKEVEAFGIRQDGNELLVPCRDSAGRIITLQRIDRGGGKRFLLGGAKRGGYHGIGGAPFHRLLIAEGYATSASLFMATGYPVACAFDAGNLTAVGGALRAKFPDIDLVFAADNDKSGVGQDRALEAAIAAGGRIVIPPEAGTDFNDVHVAHGLDAVRAVFDGADI